MLMRIPLCRGLALSLLLAIGCGGGASRNADVGYDAYPRDAGAAESAALAEVGRSVDSGGAAESGLSDGGSGADGGGVDGTADAPQPMDMAGEAGTGVDAGPARNPCDPAAIIALPLASVGTAHETGLLSGFSSLRPLTPNCGAGPTGPEVVYSLDLPAGEFHLVATTVSAAGTTVDTLVYVQTACGAGVELACNDDVGLPGPSLVSASVTGPRTIYIVVDSLTANPQSPNNAFDLAVTLTVPTQGGAACTPVDPGEIDPCGAGFVCPPAGGSAATCTIATAPVIDTAELFPQLGQAATEITLYLSARDAQGDWKNLSLVYKDVGGVVLDSSDYSMTENWGLPTLTENAISLSVPMGTASVDATLTDSTSLTSAKVNVPLTPWVSLGQTCDARLASPDQCLDDLVCVGAVCAASTEAASACALATTLGLDAPVNGIASDLLTDTFEGSCHYDRNGNDKVYRAVLPALSGNAIAWDLVGSTANPSVLYSSLSQLDTYLYVRAACADPTTELACADDIADTDLRSEVVATNLAPGVYYVFLDTSSADQNGTALTYTFRVRGRAVLPSGAACDPAGAQSRCQTGSCSVLTGNCP